MQVRRIRALVLAAGLGTRLRPLTEQRPKPLLPVCGVPILGHTLRQLADFGCEAAAVNLHYLGEPIRERFGDAHAGMSLTWSEEPEILGTLGALHPLKEFFAPADLVLVSPAEIAHRSEVDKADLQLVGRGRGQALGCGRVLGCRSQERGCNRAAAQVHFARGPRRADGDSHCGVR